MKATGHLGRAARQGVLLGVEGAAEHIVVVPLQHPQPVTALGFPQRKRFVIAGRHQVAVVGVPRRSRPAPACDVSWLCSAPSLGWHALSWKLLLEVAHLCVAFQDMAALPGAGVPYSSGAVCRRAGQVLPVVRKL